MIKTSIPQSRTDTHNPASTKYSFGQLFLIMMGRPEVNRQDQARADQTRPDQTRHSMNPTDVIWMEFLLPW